MENSMTPRLFRDASGSNVKPMLNEVEGISFNESPLDFFILLARYKFAARFIKKNHRVLDIGCGHGHGSVFLSRFGQHVTGADFDEGLVTSNRQQHAGRPNLSFEQLDLLKKPDPAKNYDVVVSMDVIEHFTKSQTEVVAANYAQLTAPGGFAVIGTPNIASQPYASARRLATHIHEFEPNEFESLLGQHFRNVFLFSMTDEVVSTSFSKMAWYLMALCVK